MQLRTAVVLALFGACLQWASAQPCNPSTYVNVSPTPGFSTCVVVCPGSVLQIHVYGPLLPNQIPVFGFRMTCDPSPATLCDFECPFPPGPIFFQYDELAWSYNSGDASFDNVILGTGEGCLCITFERLLATELSSFQAVGGDGHVALNWATANETDNAGFEIMRDGARVAEVASLGNTTSGHQYTWRDANVANGTSYTYTLIARDVTGDRAELATASATPRAGSGDVQSYALHENFPNPFNPATTITFDLVEAGFTSLRVYNIRGQELVTLVNGNQQAGTHSVQFDAQALPSGMYLYRLDVNGFSAERKMLLLK